MGCILEYIKDKYGVIAYVMYDDIILLSDDYHFLLKVGRELKVKFEAWGFIFSLSKCVFTPQIEIEWLGYLFRGTRTASDEPRRCAIVHHPSKIRAF
jgi:hypothetical protein